MLDQDKRTHETIDEYPLDSEKILKWIENANRFQESLENTLDSINSEKIGTSLNIS